MKNVIFHKMPANENCIVLFPKTESINMHEEILIMSYLNAINRTVKSIKKPPSTIDDYTVYPLMLQCSHVLELSLKFLIEKLRGHCECQHLPQVNDKNFKNDTHDFNKLIKIAKKLLPETSKSRHYFKDFQEISEWLKSSFCKYKINSTSSRYIQEISKNTYEVSKNQIYIDPYQLCENINSICRSIIYYSNGDHFIFCEAGDFNTSRVKELELALNRMEKYKNIFEEYDLSSTKKDDELFITAKDIDFHLEDEKNTALIKKISSLDTEDIFNLALGIRFFNGAGSAELYLNDVKIAGKELAVTKLASIDFFNYQTAMNELVAHIAYIKNNLD